MAEPDARCRDTEVVLAGVPGTNVEFESRNPVNYHHAISDLTSCPTVTVDGKLFAPDAGSPRPLAMVVPGSLGVGPNHLAHAQTLLAEGFAVFVLDPFGPRAVVSTVADQTQYSFAASAVDVLFALSTLRHHPAVDPLLISAQGHSRGGSAVTMAAMRPLADAVVGPHIGLAGVYAVYPWCGHQFARPRIGPTRYRAIVGELDDWVSVQQVQAQAQAIRLTGGEATCRVVGGAHHSFDRREPVHVVDDAAVAPHAPTVLLGDDGTMIEPRTGEADPASTDHDLFVAAMKAGFGRQGARMGGISDQPELFTADMVGFHRAVLGSPAR